VATYEKTGIVDEKMIVEILKKEGCFNIFKWRDSAGTRYAEHSHPYDEVRWVLSGTLEITESGKTIRLEPGDKLCSEAGVAHTAFVPEDVVYICGSKKG